MNTELNAVEIETTALKSGEHFKSGLNCAESVLLAVTTLFGIQSEFFPQIATGFCAGVSRTSHICGAISGGVMVLGLKYGRQSKNEPVDITYSKVQQFITQFEANFGSCNCRELTGMDLLTEDGRQTYIENKGREFCQGVTEKATWLALTLMQD